ncbi:protein wech-like [Mya arenaria]|uniref:protein wech-like n=1 Tax=Mya arenaria TaxID=6604 RepID=UPI0022E64770|nr:protein wech-like [Mya arenaria]
MAECAEKVAKTSDNADSVGGKEKEETENRVKLCGPCFEEGNEVPATKFCVDCDDHLCETCVQYHRKVKLIKNHKLIDISAVVQCSKKKERKADVFNCTIHQEELTHYCEKHGKLCCLKCVRGIHTMCGDSVCKVDEAADKIEENRIFKEFVDKLHRLVVKAQENEKRATAKIETGMEQFKRQIESARKMADEEVGRIKTIASSMDSITGELSKWKNLVENAKKAKDYGKLFIAMKLATEQLEFHDESIHALERNSKWSLKLTIQGRNPYSLQEMDASGITRIKHKEDVLSSIASVDMHSAIDEETGSMFLIGKEPFGLREVTKDGEVNTIALSKPIESPGGIVLESDGTFLVSSVSGKNIKRVTVEGSVEDFITGLEFEPHGLGFDKQRRLLYVGGFRSNAILMYSI